MKSNYIISPSDKRYGKLGHIWKNYDYLTGHNPIVLRIGKSIYRYRIPRYLTIDDSDEDIISKSLCTLRYHLKKRCNITEEEFVLLMLYKTNNRSDYPRCPVCRKRIRFTNATRGYNTSGRLIGDVEIITCSMSCATNIRINNGNLLGLKDNKILSNTSRSWFINHNKDKKCYFYIASIDNGIFKFGISSNPSVRKRLLGSYENHRVNNMKVLCDGSATEIANLEYKIKEILNNREEFLKFEGTMQSFRIAYHSAIKILGLTNLE